MLELPSDGQSFPKIRNYNLLYVDKTKYLYPIIKKPGCYFLSRPRRFGKSLLLGALEALLKGRRELFKDLWIDQTDYDFKPYPVITLTMSGLGRGEKKLERSMINKLNVQAKINGLPLPDDLPADDALPGDLLEMMVASLHERTKEPVVILVDEYDAPIQDVIDDLDLAETHRLVLHRFYSALKTLADRDMTHLIYVTGVTKFTQTSVFSVFNNYTDLTLNPDFNAICGFTIEEFEAYFSKYLPQVLIYNQLEGFMSNEATINDLKNDIIGYYDGYSWNGKTRVLNPFSLVKMLSNKLLRAYWFGTATPSFLMELLKRAGSGFELPVNPTMTTSDLDAVDINYIELVPILFQTGYLTIDKMLAPDEYLLRRPNREVSEALDSHLLKFLLGKTTKTVIKLRERIREALEKSNSTSLAACFHDILSWNSHMALKASEGGAQAIIHSVMKAMHFNIVSEVTEAHGVIDFLIVTRNDTVFVCEFKFEKLQPKKMRL